MGAQMSPAQMIQQNLAMRQMLLNTAFRYTKDLGVNTQGVLSGTSRIKLYNVGITTRLLLLVTATIDFTGSGGVISNKGPFNLINRIRVTDYDGSDRVNCSGMALQMINSLRLRTLYGFNNEAATAILTNPKIPTTGSAQTVTFFMEVPLAYSNTDLRGAILSQTALGELTLSIDWIASLFTASNDDALYTGGVTAAALTAGTNITVQVWQEYLQPQQVQGGIPIPQLDLRTVYAIEGAVRSSDNLAAGTEKLISYPNLRSVIGTYVGYMNNSLMDSTNVTKHRVIANGNNIITDRLNAAQLFEQRLYLNSDTRAGQYFMQHRDRPVETQLFGNVQYGFTPTTVTGTANCELTFESFYPKGVALPGLTQSST